MNKKIPIIFLDIDGVLATSKQYFMNSAKFMSKNEWAKELKVPYPFDSKCVKIFNEILTKTGAEIVLSSDWKQHWDLAQLDIIFKNNGVIKSPVDITTDDMVSLSSVEKNRSHQILTYIKKNKPERCSIIDDLHIISFINNDDIKNCVIKTGSAEGIKQVGVKDKIIKTLTEDLHKNKKNLDIK